MNNPLVTVIITTIGSEFVSRAVASAINQSYGNLQILICYDGDNFESFYKFIDNSFDNIEVLNVGPFNNANNARQKGIESAKGDFIALLDDDDYWAVDHLKNLVHQANNIGKPVLLISKSVIMKSDKVKEILPERFYDYKNESIPEYLFCFKKNKRTMMQTSSFFFSSSLGIAIPFDIKLKQHQDYDWVIRVYESGIAKIEQINMGTSFYVLDANSSSISKISKVDMSLSWAERVLTKYGKDVIFNFIMNNTVHFCVRNKENFIFLMKLGIIYESNKIPIFGFFWKKSFICFSFKYCWWS